MKLKHYTGTNCKDPQGNRKTNEISLDFSNEISVVSHRKQMDIFAYGF